MLFDEAGMAPTRQSAALFFYAEHAGAKVIAAGDPGQLPSVQAGGWFRAITHELGGPELRAVMRQRNPDERAALEALHDGDPGAYIEFKRHRGALEVHARESDALAKLLDQWDAARADHGLHAAVMIAPDNTTRARLNQEARRRLIGEGWLAENPVTIAGREFFVGERVIARRNDRFRDVDNGTCATVRAIDPLTGTLTVEPDGGGRRELDAAYVAEHLEHAYALTGHGSQGATVEWVGVVGRPAQFTAEWSYTALSRAREQTRLHLIAEPSARFREREQFAPPEVYQTLEDALNATRSAMMRRGAEKLAIEHAEPAKLLAVDALPQFRLPLGQFAEAGAEHAFAVAGPDENGMNRGPPPEPDWRALRQQRDRLKRHLHLGR